MTHPDSPVERSGNGRLNISRRTALKAGAVGFVPGVGTMRAGRLGRLYRQESSAGPYFPAGPTVAVETVADGLVAPTDFTVVEGVGDVRFVADQTGQVWIHEAGGFRDEPFIDVTDLLVDVGSATEGGFDERGLLGVAFHPEFAENGKFYLHYSAPNRPGTPADFDHTEVISEFRADGCALRGDVDSECVLLEIPSPQFNHDAGAMAFGPDGYLYIGMGDGGGADDVGLGHVEDWYDANEGGNGQDVTDNLLGSIIRIDVNDETGGAPYAVPDDNPLVGREGMDELYAWGLRNPWRLSFNDGDLIVADVGQNLYEEVNVVEKGGNYGWNVKEATHCFSTESPTEPPESCPDATPDDVRGGEPLVDPVFEYPHTHQGEPVGISITGGHILGEEMGELAGTYVFGDWSVNFAEPQGRLFAAGPDAFDVPDDHPQRTVPAADGLWTGAELQVDGGFGHFVRAFGRGLDGETYVLTSQVPTPTGETGKVLRLTMG